MAMDMRQYLAFRCSEMLKMERDILQMNNIMAGEVQQGELKQQFQRHSGTTEQQIRNLEQAVDRLGGAPQSSSVIGQVTEALGVTSDQGTPVTKGMMQEHKMFMGLNPPQSLIDLNDALEGDKVEHLEMASYHGMIALAQQMGEQDIVALLRQNLQGEEQMCSTIEKDVPALLSQFGGQGRAAA